MAKRSRRQRKAKAGKPQRYSKGRLPARPPAQAATRTAKAGSKSSAQRAEPPAAATSTASTATTTVDFAKEYHYVIQDLRRLFILAVAMMALLVVLAYFLT